MCTFTQSLSSLCADSTLHIRSDVNRKGFKEYEARCLGNATSEERVNDFPMGAGSEAPALGGPGPGTPPRTAGRAFWPGSAGAPRVSPPSARLPLRRSLTVFPRGFAKVLYVGLSQVPELFHPPHHTGHRGRHGQLGARRPVHVTAAACDHLMASLAGRGRSPRSRWAET